MDKALAYESNLKKFRNSYVATYHLYTLKNPFNNEIFYVGVTKMGLIGRLAGHISDYGSSNKPKKAYIQDIVSRGSKPIIESLEIVEGLSRIDAAYALEREYQWIQHHKSIGCKLLNVFGMEGRSSTEYIDYLDAVKAGRFNLDYYFCGFAFDGYWVYDEKRITADGFKLKKSLPETEIIRQFVDREGQLQKFYDELRQEVRAGEWPPAWINIDLFKSILPMPDWSPEFAADIPPDEFLLDLEIDECDLEIDDPPEMDDWDEAEDAELMELYTY